MGRLRDLAQKNAKDGNRADRASKRAQIVAQCVAGAEAYWEQRAHVVVVDQWSRGDQYNIDETEAPGDHSGGQPFVPRGRDDDEVEDLRSRTPAPFGRLVVSSLAQTIFMEGAKIAGSDSEDTLECVDVLRRNNWNAKQIPLTRAVVAHGLAYAKLLPAEDIFRGEASIKVTVRSAKDMIAFFDELGDDYPTHTLEFDQQPSKDGRSQWSVTYTDETGAYILDLDGRGLEEKDWNLIGPVQLFGDEVVVCPVVEFTNIEDLEGRSTGEIEPIIPLLRRLDQDTFDRLIVQRFGAWKIRWIAGMLAPATDNEQRAQAMQLRVQDLLVSENAETKFGTLDATEIKGFIEAHDADLRILSAVTQTPPHHLLGLSANLQAEALAAAEAGLQRKATDFKVFNSGSYQKLLRLIAVMKGNVDEANADEYQINYRDTESRSLNQAAQALGALATQLGIPVEMLWNRIPDWSDDDTERALELIEDAKVEQLLAAAAASNDPNADPNNPGQSKAPGGANNDPKPPGVVGAQPAGVSSDQRS